MLADAHQSSLPEPLPPDWNFGPNLMIIPVAADCCAFRAALDELHQLRRHTASVCVSSPLLTIYTSCAAAGGSRAHLDAVDPRTLRRTSCTSGLPRLLSATAPAPSTAYLLHGHGEAVTTMSRQ